METGLVVMYLKINTILLFEVIEVCFRSMLIHNALTYSQAHHFFGFPGNISGVVFAICSEFLYLHAL